MIMDQKIVYGQVLELTSTIIVIKNVEQLKDLVFLIVSSYTPQKV